MNKLFAYDSPPMQILMFVGDLIILNLLYLICCIPLFTIGAAQAGLHTAIKVLLDKEDDSSPAAAFFRGFASGFGTVTLAWGLTTVVLLLVAFLSVSAVQLGSPVWLVVFAIALCCIFQSLIPAFHARFGCSPWQLIRNSWFLLFAHPLRSIGVAVIVWLPVLLFLLGDLYVFMSITPIWGTLYYSTTFCFAHGLMKKPVKTLTDHFNETHGIKPEGEPPVDAESEVVSEEIAEAEEVEETPVLPE